MRLNALSTMSKAFTRESDEFPDQPALPRPLSVLPSGAKNYVTPAGARQLREELERLVQVERPQIAAEGRSHDLPGGPPHQRQLQVLDQRIRQLQQSLQSAVVMPPPVGMEDRVRFGATVTVREGSGERPRYRIVGVDEADIDRGWVSWLSPIAKSLLNARLGQLVRVKLPSGDVELEIVEITYE